MRAALLAGLCAAASPLAAQVPDWSLAARQRLSGTAPDQAMAERQRLLDEAEQRLAQGSTAQAQERLDRAALMLHAADTEATLVRSYMQAGEYRRALAFGAHAAGAHKREWPAGMALYGWLLRLGGQEVVARRALADARADAPDEPALTSAAAWLGDAWPRPGAAFMQPPLRLAPYAVGEPVPTDARVVGSAVLLPDGTAALAPAALLSAADRGLWLRNGLGQTVAASPDGPADAQGVQRLRLGSPLPAPSAASASRAPFAGSPGYLVEFAPGDAAPAWPLLRQGFFARLPATPGPRALGIESPPGPRGGPVFDAWGRWAGLALTGPDGVDRLIPVSDLLPPGAIESPAAATATAPARPGADEVYERALRQALQLLRLP